MLHQWIGWLSESYNIRGILEEDLFSETLTHNKRLALDTFNGVNENAVFHEISHTVNTVDGLKNMHE